MADTRTTPDGDTRVIAGGDIRVVLGPSAIAGSALASIYTLVAMIRRKRFKRKR